MQDQQNENMMTILVLGANGATGKQLVRQLLQMRHRVKALVRSVEKIPESWMKDERLTVIEGSISEMNADTIARHLKDCHAAASCLGHNLSLKGIYGKPRKLVTDAVALTCTAVKKHVTATRPFRFVLMNTTGNSNRDLKEPVSLGQKIVVGFMRFLMPPQVDNESAADYLRTQIGQNDEQIEWSCVRPDTLIDRDTVTDYSLHPSPTRSAIFNPGKTSRINVGHFMVRLLTEDELWENWKGQMPVIYNVT